ncbi:MAG TPA: bifunctional riboflavin kinase/FAD synthetase [Burkholderiales bacterium]|nr:bifunctional riboflavin kinase/FAD synthetase [Burkholderiales bacterium]
MLISRSLAPRELPPAAWTIGNFDGVHLGHQAMLRELQAAAKARGLRASVLTFEPHPRELFNPAAAPTRLTSLREKLELLAEHGIEHVHVQRFTRAFAAMSAEDFTEQLLVGQLQARWVLVGEDFRYGARRSGDLAQLKKAGKRRGVEVHAMPTVEASGARVSSSAIREALAAGDLKGAEALLGRTYSISGRVVRGLQLGRKLGFPTANVQMKHNRPPLMGIYAVRVHGVGAAPRDGVGSIGLRPTVDSSGKKTLEVHLFDFAESIYGRHVRVEFVTKIRDEVKYPDLESLKAQIAQDCETARSMLLTKN